MSVKKVSMILLLPVSFLISLWGAVHVATTQGVQYSYASPSGQFNQLLFGLFGGRL